MKEKYIDEYGIDSLPQLIVASQKGMDVFLTINKGLLKDREELEGTFNIKIRTPGELSQMKNKQTKKAEILFIIDSTALKDMFEGKNKAKSNDLLNKLKEMKDSGKEVLAITTLSSFLRAIFLADSKVNINKIQKTLTFLKVAPSFADFKNEEAVRKELIKFAGAMSGNNN